MTDTNEKPNGSTPQSYRSGIKKLAEDLRRRDVDDSDPGDQISE